MSTAASGRMRPKDGSFVVTLRELISSLVTGFIEFLDTTLSSIRDLVTTMLDMEVWDLLRVAVFLVGGCIVLGVFAVIVEDRKRSAWTRFGLFLLWLIVCVVFVGFCKPTLNTRVA